ncbi:MAG: recombinase family protein, partial [Acidobacteriota bacterium]|nr:recombinase family protein [Acidobacteriota bacterium]
LGLRNRKGKRVTRNGISKMLHNPFYLGVIKVHTQDEIYAGQHRPIISRDVFDRVQAVLEGKNIKGNAHHQMLFRRMLVCAGCQTKLIGELQKGYIYYRCHTKSCRQKSIREDEVEAALLPLLKQLRFSRVEGEAIRRNLKLQYQSIEELREARSKSLHMQLDQIQNRLSKVIDAYIDGAIEKDLYLQKKNQLVMEENAAKRLLENLAQIEHRIINRVEGIIELVNNAYLSYKVAYPGQRREIVEIVTSNLSVEDKKLIIKLKYPFEIIHQHRNIADGSPQRATDRTVLSLISQLKKYFEDHPEEQESDLLSKKKLSVDEQLELALKVSEQRWLYKRAA